VVDVGETERVMLLRLPAAVGVGVGVLATDSATLSGSL
jgi:hypothetical protein